MKKLDYFIVKEVTISTSGKLEQFEVKLPGDARHCIGYRLSANTFHSTKTLANIGISFNGGRENTIIRDLIVRNPSNIKRRTTLLPQRQKLLQNAYIKGYVEDLGNAPSYPYIAKIYFHLSTN